MRSPALGRLAVEEEGAVVARKGGPAAVFRDDMALQAVGRAHDDDVGVAGLAAAGGGRQPRAVG